MRNQISPSAAVVRSRAGHWVLLAVAIIAGATLATVPLATAANAATGKSSLTRIDHHNPLTSVSCPSATFCAAVDGYGNALTYNGTRWSRPTSVDRGKGFFASASVSCPSATFCAMVDQRGNALTYNGTNWSAPTNIDGVGGDLTSVSCPSASFCVAVDSGGAALTYNGISWSTPTRVEFGAPSAALNSVSCPSASFCVAVDSGGGAVTYNGTSWSAPVGVVPPPFPGIVIGLNSVSCSSASFCATVSFIGLAFTYNGTDWSTAANVVPYDVVDHPPNLDSVSCPSASSCVAVASGGIVTYDGYWTAPAGIDLFGGLNSVSCSSASSCVAVDSYGHALPYDGLTINTTSLPSGTVGQTYSATVSASGGNPPYSWRLLKGYKLPRGLRLNPSTGVISGKPMASGTTDLAFVVKDTAATSTKKPTTEITGLSLTIS